MCPTSKEKAQNGNVKRLETRTSSLETEDSDLLRMMNRPRPVNIERNRSFDERSFSELSTTLSPPRISHIFDFLDTTYSPGRWTGSPRSACGYETHPMVGEAWEALRRSLVHFRGNPVGTIAALDHSSEELNYDQVKFCFFLFTCEIHLACNCDCTCLFYRFS